MDTSSVCTRHVFLPGFSTLLLSALLALCPVGGFAQGRSTVGSYQVSGPYHYKNLSVFLVHGKDLFSGRKIITLEEGLARGIVKVYETGSVNQLEIENLSNDTEVYVQAGDIVKGGRQDRTLGIDLTLAPGSGKIPITSFCVERGRWTQRGEESSSEFSSSTAVVASNDLRLAVRASKSQSDVWANVSVMQTKLSENVGVQVNAVGAAVPVVSSGSPSPAADVLTVIGDTIDARMEFDEAAVIADVPADRISINDLLLQEEPAHYVPLRNAAVLPNRAITLQQNSLDAYNSSVTTTTSLQLSLENAELIDEVEEYMAALQRIVGEHDDVVGFAFTINGEMKNADVYGSRDLFAQLWPKLLRAAATEAVSERNGVEGDQVGSVDAVRTCFLDAEKAGAEREEIGERIILTTRRSDENVLFETQEKGSDEWLHRNYMKLE